MGPWTSNWKRLPRCLVTARTPRLQCPQHPRGPVPGHGKRLDRSPRLHHPSPAPHYRHPLCSWCLDPVLPFWGYPYVSLCSLTDSSITPQSPVHHPSNTTAPPPPPFCVQNAAVPACVLRRGGNVEEPCLYLVTASADDVRRNIWGGIRSRVRCASQRCSPPLPGLRTPPPPQVETRVKSALASHVVGNSLSARLMDKKDVPAWVFQDTPASPQSPTRATSTSPRRRSATNTARMPPRPRRAVTHSPPPRRSLATADSSQRVHVLLTDVASSVTPVRACEGLSWGGRPH